jgi:hypothetical protein
VERWPHDTTVSRCTCHRDPSILSGDRNIGHVGRYRHTDACEAFLAAAPRRIKRDGATLNPRMQGESYKVDVHEQVIGRAFEHVVEILARSGKSQISGAAHDRA